MKKSKAFRFSTSGLIFSSLSLAILMGLSACSRGGRSVARVDLCPVGYDPINLEKAKDSPNYSNKVNLKSGEGNLQDLGEFQYDSSQVYYVDSEKDIELHLVHSLGQEAPSIRCIGGKGFKPGLNEVVEVPIISDINLTSDNKTTYKVRIFKIRIQPNNGDEKWFPMEISAASESYKEGSPVSEYTSIDPVAEQFLFKVRETNATVPMDFIAKLETQPRQFNGNGEVLASAPKVELRVHSRVSKRID